MSTSILDYDIFLKDYETHASGTIPPPSESEIMDLVKENAPTISKEESLPFSIEETNKFNTELCIFYFDAILEDDGSIKVSYLSCDAT